MCTAINSLSSMAVDKEVLLDKQQIPFHSGEISTPDNQSLSSTDAEISDLSPDTYSSGKRPIQKERPKEEEEEESNHFVLLHDIRSNLGAKTKERPQTLLRNGDVKDSRRFHLLSKSEPVISRNILYQKYTDHNNNSNNLSRSLKHDVPRIVVTNPHDKPDWDGVVLRNQVSKFISRHYGHNSYHGEDYALSVYGTPLHYQPLTEDYKLVHHHSSYENCKMSDDNDEQNYSWGSLNMEDKKSWSKRSSLPASQLSSLDMIVHRNGFKIKNSRSLDSDAFNKIQHGDEKKLHHVQCQTVPKKKSSGVGNCFRSITTSISSEPSDDPPRSRHSRTSSPAASIGATEDNSNYPTVTLRRNHNKSPTENRENNPLRKTCPPDILRKKSSTEFECDIYSRPISSSLKLGPCNHGKNYTTRISTSARSSPVHILSSNRRTPSPTNFTRIPRSELKKPFPIMPSPVSKRAKSPCQRTIERVSLTLEKSKSEPDLESVFKKIKSKNSSPSSSLKNLFFPSSPSAMQKAKSSPSNKILSKRWRNKYKGNPNNTTSIWRPEGYCTWSSVGGRKVVLQPTNILSFSKTSEQTALQQVALSKVQDIIQGCSVVIPKACSDVKRHKKTMMKKRSQSVNLGGLLEHLTQKDRDKADKDEPQPMGLVFGIPLTRCITNDNELRKRRQQQNSAENVDQHKNRNQSSSSHGSTENLPRQNGNPSHSGNTANNRSFHAGSSDSLSESDASSRHTGGSTNLIDALSLSMTGRDSLHNENFEHLNSEGPMVPQIVTTCFKHIETYGLHVLGIFRVGSSKKRVKQLRDEFDSGKDVVLDDTQNPHDVGALLKEYFRDLPEPLLTRDLYSPFVATRRIQCAKQQALAVKLLVALLPVPIRDTLWSLMKFLKKVAEHSMDSIGENGEVLAGNKMDSSNLATLFGPNILHKAKSSGEREYLVESTARAEERKEVIEVVKDMIDRNTSMFEISAEMYDEVLRQIMEDDPAACDRHLKLLASELGVDTDLDTSYGSVFDDGSYRQSPQHYASASDILQGSRNASTNSNRPILRHTASTSSPTHYPTSDSERDDTDPRQGMSDYHDRQARRILRQRGKQSPVKIQTTSPPTTAGGLRVPGARLQQRSLSSDKDNRATQTTTLTIPQQSQYVRQNSCPGLSSSPLSSPPVSPVVPFSRPLGSTCSRQNTPVDNKGSRSERELSQTGRTRQLTRSRDASPMDRLKISPSSSTTITISGTPSGATSLQHGQPPCPASTDTHLVRSAAWQRERWRHWEILTTDSSDDAHEQETLV